MADSIFTKMVKGEYPCQKIYEDDKTLAFLDIRPMSPGHTLVIPKIQVDHIWDLAEDDYLAVMKTAKIVAEKIRRAYSPKRVGVHIQGLEVPHAHVHVFGFDTHEDFVKIPSTTATPEELAVVAAKLNA